MSADAFRSYDELLAELRRLCAERRTGTLFIATAANEGGQLVVANTVTFRKPTLDKTEITQRVEKP